jgi:transposase
MNVSLWSEIRRLYLAQGVYKKEIARRLGLSVKTVRKALRQESPPSRITRLRESKLDAFKERMTTLLSDYPGLSAIRIYEKIREQGYEGSVTLLRYYLRRVRPVQREVFVRIETEPGEEAQVDWGMFGDYFGTGRILSCLAFVLSHSRMMTLTWTLSQRMEDFLASHRNAFHFIGGVPQKILYDNLKSVVASRIGRDIRFNPRFMAFAGTYLFEPVACNVRAGNEKGKVERTIGYVRHNFFAGRVFKDLADLRAQSDRWRDGIANVRIHGTLRRRPIDRFEAEKKVLRPLPSHPFDCDVVLTVTATPTCRVSFDANTYTVPSLYARLPLTLRANEMEVRIFKLDRVIAAHPRCWQKYRDIEDPRHTRDILDQKQKAVAAKQKDFFLSLGSVAEDYLKGLIATPRSLTTELRKINALVTVYGKTEILQAIHQAIPFRAFGAEYLKNIILQNLTRRGAIQPLSPVDPKTRPELVSLTVQERDLKTYDDMALGKEDPDE